MVADDDMIDEADPDELCGLFQLTRELDILLRRCRISALSVSACCSTSYALAFFNMSLIIYLLCQSQLALRFIHLILIRMRAMP